MYTTIGTLGLSNKNWSILCTHSTLGTESLCRLKMLRFRGHIENKPQRRKQTICPPARPLPDRSFQSSNTFPDPNACPARCTGGTEPRLHPSCPAPSVPHHRKQKDHLTTPVQGGLERGGPPGLIGSARGSPAPGLVVAQCYVCTKPPDFSPYPKEAPQADQNQPQTLPYKAQRIRPKL